MKMTYDHLVDSNAWYVMNTGDISLSGIHGHAGGGNAEGDKLRKAINQAKSGVYRWDVESDLTITSLERVLEEHEHRAIPKALYVSPEWDLIPESKRFGGKKGQMLLEAVRKWKNEVHRICEVNGIKIHKSTRVKGDGWALFFHDGSRFISDGA